MDWEAAGPKGYLSAWPPLWVPGSGSNPGSPTAMPTSCSQTPHEFALGSLGDMVPLSCVLCSSFSHSLPSLGYSVLFMIPLYHHYYFIRYIYIVRTREAEPIGYTKRLILMWLGGLTSRKSGCSGRSWCSLESKICSIKGTWLAQLVEYVTLHKIHSIDQQAGNSSNISMLQSWDRFLLF